MAKLSSYNTVNVYGSGDYLPLHNSGVSNSRIFPSSLINQYLGFTGSSGKIFATNGSSGLWITNSASPGGSSNQVQFNSGGLFGGSSNFIYDWTNNRFGFHGPNNASLPVSFASTIGPSGNNSIDLGHVSYVWATGHFNGIAFSGARFNSSTHFGVIYISGSNLKTESAFIYNDIENRLYADLITVTGLNVVGSHTGILPSTASNSGKVLSNDGAGAYYWITQGATSPGGSNTHIQFNSGNAFSGKSTFSFDYTNNIASLTGTLIVDTLIVNSSISGAAYTHFMPYGWSFPSGVISGTGVNVSYEIPILADCILQSGGYSQIRAKVAGSGHPSGLMVDINYNGTSIWDTAQGMRLSMPNNTRSGNQPNFSYSGILERGGYLSLDFDFCPTGILAQDVIIELLTIAKR